MSYDIELLDPVTKTVLLAEVDHCIRGGTYAMGGTRELHLNVTYNYAPHFKRVMGDDGIRRIYGMSGAQSKPVLEEAFSRLADDADDDYWKPTEGNAKRAIAGLLAFANLRPDGVWGGD